MTAPQPSDRERLRRTFDRAAELYQQARPDYPTELFDELIDLAGLRKGDHLLEIGCATGKATLPLAAYGFQISCVELGSDLAAAARRNLAPFPNVTVTEGRFEEWTPPTGGRFDLVLAATTWHWLDPDVRYAKAWALLRPGGHLAFWNATHVFPDGGDSFFRDLQEVYDEIGERLPPDASWPRPGEVDDERAEITATGLFDNVAVRHFDWEVTYDADGYVNLLDTFSGHIAMEQWQRDRLYGEIR
ncbi:MAG TPA: class I SAM-dependent methyltransferase, partial [Acidimicrobiales bacterium]|nr:class I SAM-dependent methyltransferase [Acidimicrobiales bacterium]